MYNYNVEFVFEHMVIITNVFFSTPPDELEDVDAYVINLAEDTLKNYYKIDPEVLYLQDIIVHKEN